MFWAAMPAILSGWRRMNRKFLPDSSLAQCRKGVFQRGWGGPEEFAQSSVSRANARFHVFDLKKYRQKYRHFEMCPLQWRR